MLKRGLFYRLKIVVLLVLSALPAVVFHPVRSAEPLYPYLQAATANSVFVLVETKTAEPVAVEYGTTSLDKQAVTTGIKTTTARPATYVQRIKLAGLSPHTVYQYRVFQGGNASPVFKFMTAAEPGTGFRFAWMADCRTGIAVHDRIAARISAANPAFSLYGGDLCQSPDYASWQKEFFTPNERALIASVPFFNVSGNHEGWKTNTIAFTQAPESASGTQAYYSFDYGDVHFLAVNNLLPFGEGSPQYDFIVKDLAATKRIWKIVFAHVPAYCAGGHGENSGMIRLSAGVFKPKGVDLVIAGHSHFYQHNLVDGIHHLIIGSAGAPLVTPGNAPYTIKSVKDYDYAIIDVAPDSLHVTVCNDKGDVLDTVELKK